MHSCRGRSVHEYDMPKFMGEGHTSTWFVVADGLRNGDPNVDAFLARIGQRLRSAKLFIMTLQDLNPAEGSRLFSRILDPIEQIEAWIIHAEQYQADRSCDPLDLIVRKTWHPKIVKHLGYRSSLSDAIPSINCTRSCPRTSRT